MPWIVDDLVAPELARMVGHHLIVEENRLSDQPHADALHRRYCNFWRVDSELELNAARVGLPTKRAARKPARAPEDAATPISVDTPPKRRVPRAKAKAPAAD